MSKRGVRSKFIGASNSQLRKAYSVGRDSYTTAERAKILDVNEEFLKSIGELCNKPDFEKETLTNENLHRAKIIN